MKKKDDLELREPVVAYGKRTFSIEEYLAYENASLEKHEYYHGEIFAMAGSGNKHNAIFSDFFIGLGIALKGSTCFPFGSDMRLHIPSNTLFTYPDIAVYCKDTLSMFSDTTATLPIALIEILSPSTRKYDRGMKFELYKEISSLKEYILVDPEKILIDIYRRCPNNSWEMEHYTARNKNIKIKALNITLPISDIYAHVDWMPGKSSLSPI